MTPSVPLTCSFYALLESMFRAGLAAFTAQSPTLASRYRA
jgi:hypothetical protein